jgi:hypothetical protein
MLEESRLDFELVDGSDPNRKSGDPAAPLLNYLAGVIFFFLHPIWTPSSWASLAVHPDAVRSLGNFQGKLNIASTQPLVGLTLLQQGSIFTSLPIIP